MPIPKSNSTKKVRIQKAREAAKLWSDAKTKKENDMNKETSHPLVTTRDERIHIDPDLPFRKRKRILNDDVHEHKSNLKRKRYETISNYTGINLDVNRLMDEDNIACIRQEMNSPTDDQKQSKKSKLEKEKNRGLIQAARERASKWAKSMKAKK